MYPTGSIGWRLLKAGRFLVPGVLLLLSASIADAGQASHQTRHRRAAHTTRAHGTPCPPPVALCTFVRRQRSKGGPLRQQAHPGALAVHHQRPVLTRGSFVLPNDGDQAIQNDAPVAQLGIDENVQPGLRELCLLACPCDRLPDSSAFTPRSPRGPPLVL
jgi:hypothetical protein